MAVNTLIISQTYVGNGSTTIFPIPFPYFDPEQILVELIDTTVTPNVAVQQINNVNFFLGSNGVGMVVAPPVGTNLQVSRSTPLLQKTSYIETGKFLLEDHEHALDYLEMQIQEVAAIANEALTGSGGAVPVGGGQCVRLADQTLPAGGSITPATSARTMIGVQGLSGPQTLSPTIPLQNGTSDLQEVRLVGRSDDNPITINHGGNISLNGAMVLGLNAVLDLFWDNNQALWIESGRNT